jgi:5-oxoprolinase (ATP-hydrolysing)
LYRYTEDAPLDVDATRAAFELEAERINNELGSTHDGSGSGSGSGGGSGRMTPEEVALGYLRVANEAMCRPIREITESKGYDTASHVLAAFGGAGPQHACAIARALGMSTVFVHRFCGILSAYGMGLADVVAEAQRPFAGVYGAGGAGGGVAGTAPGREEAAAAAAELTAQVMAEITEQGFTEEQCGTETLLNLRYEGTDTAIMTPEPADGDFAAAFRARFTREYGFDLTGRDLVIDDVRVRGVANSTLLRRIPIRGVKRPGESLPEPDSTTSVYFEGGWRETPVYLLGQLLAGAVMEGPAVVMNGTSTCIIEPRCVAEVTEYGDLKIEVNVASESSSEWESESESESEVGASGSESKSNNTPDAVQLSIFSNRFMGIAEQMGRTLQRTSVSTNIKERLDFSCALFGPGGGLVANAPHVPVHLAGLCAV